jgi:hypothetical protein
MEENQLSPEIKTKILKFLKEVESTNVFADDFDENNVLETFSVAPRLILNFLAENDYVEDYTEQVDDGVVEIYISKGNPNYIEDDEDDEEEKELTISSIEYFKIKMCINFIDFSIELIIDLVLN